MLQCFTMNRRAQVVCIDMQSNPDGEYKYIMVYQDHLTKWTVLRPLKTKKAEEIAENLVNTFCHFGSPVPVPGQCSRTL